MNPASPPTVNSTVLVMSSPLALIWPASVSAATTKPPSATPPATAQLTATRPVRPIPRGKSVPGAALVDSIARSVIVASVFTLRRLRRLPRLVARAGPQPGHDTEVIVWQRLGSPAPRWVG